ncbi:sugar ABC transporter ATP-binding protein [Christensenella timonensis]|uniref:sugar ABC transporter ATP-binding protein n=1 Tax=Christensenella timonensis TaxID=1816678 RepID=UPI00082B91C8|nr:sugar ABC transporter ATP-binding protein [Christensenella timonensis]
MPEHILEIKNISKHFTGVKALDDVSFNIVKGSCHCLVGENGAGKSTLIKILTGAHPKTSGTILYNGKEFNPSSTKDAMKSGIGCLFQELNVVEKLRVEENICLGLEETKFGIIKKSSNQKVFDVLRRIDATIEPKQYIEELSVAKRQVVEMAKALAMDSDVIIMDEPTAALTEEEVNRLFEIIADLKKQGITIIYISHRLEEIMELADYITVLRDGKHIETKPRSEVADRSDLIQMMIGKVIVEDYVPNDVDKTKKAIEVKSLTTDKLKNINFDLYKGEILGFYGLIGAGKTEIARALFGADPFIGEVLVDGEAADLKTPGKALAKGIALVPEERRTQGICTALSIASNTPMMNYKTVSKNGMLNKAKQAEIAKEYIESIGIACRNENQSVAYLSGGNQQKVVLAKCLNADPKVLLLDEPTRGVDVGAKQEIYQIIRKMVKDGCSAVVFSSELPEILGLCDRIVLLFDGEVKAVMNNDETLKTQEIMHIVTGGGTDHE